MHIRGKLIFLLMTLALCFGGQVSAQETSKDNIDKAQAANRVLQKVNGRVLRVNQSKNTYKVKVLQKNGRVVTVDVDKRSGKITKQRSRDK
ncbi:MULTISPECIES: PepSY domain-containing protein [Alteromonadaceae]|uniref:PepSY domain-containing protein n=1 Tax=Alteromonadaceae TaxID=72275 RepID=UPI0026E22ED2|nr:MULTISPECIES: PepSY domain-containing protein [unclassified Aliiglaciecola]MDO6711873.1 PepSY domain-containing protein [Aliiglaciecola sp. 2_MG-2023]MDO6752953.1 PepSY domain-containing protein [Aliiglaciecola sp. 1_MG-2023]